MESLTRFIMSKLKLQVNQQKSAVARSWARKFLGFSFTSAGTPKRRIAPKAVGRFKERIRELTSRNRGVCIERMAEELSLYLRALLSKRLSDAASWTGQSTRFTPLAGPETFPNVPKVRPWLYSEADLA